MQLKHLDIIENDYQVVDWYVEPEKGYESTFSNIRPFEGMNELPDYRDSGVYGTAGVPYSVYQVDPYRFPHEEPYLAFAKDYSELVYQSVRRGSGFLCTGSYCTHIPSILGGIRRALPERKIGVVWVDAHADNHIVENTEIKKLRLLGVPMSTFLGQTYPQWRDAVGLEPPIDGRHVIASDIRYFSGESDRNLKDKNVCVISQNEFRQPDLWKEKIQALAQRVDVIFMHVDADILHHSYLPAYEYDVIDGNKLPIVRENIGAVAATGKMIGATVMCIGFEDKPDRERDVNNINGIRLLSSILQNWEQIPNTIKEEK